MDPVVPVPMEPELLNDLVEKAKDYALMHGEFQCMGTGINKIIPSYKFIDLSLSSRNLHAAEGRVRSGCAALCAVPASAFALPRHRVSKSFETTGKLKMT